MLGNSEYLVYRFMDFLLKNQVSNQCLGLNRRGLFHELSLLVSSSFEQAKMNKKESKSSFFIIIGFTTKVIIFFRGLEIAELKE